MMLNRRKFVFVVLAIVLFLGGGTLWLDSQYVPPILMYHKIEVNVQRDSETVSPESFQKQQAYLKNHGYHVLRLDELVRCIKNGKRLPPRSVVLTFDDGRKNNLTQALPVLKRYGFSAVFFIVNGYVGQPGYMTWQEINRMLENGMEIGSHGMTHAYLPDIPAQSQRYEIFQSKKALEQQLKIPVDFFCYPVGGFSQGVKELVKEAGYRGALATNRGTHRRRDDVYELRRIKIVDTDNNNFILWAKLSGFYNLFRQPKSPY